MLRHPAERGTRLKIRRTWFTSAPVLSISRLRTNALIAARKFDPRSASKTDSAKLEPRKFGVILEMQGWLIFRKNVFVHNYLGLVIFHFIGLHAVQVANNVRDLFSRFVRTWNKSQMINRKYKKTSSTDNLGRTQWTRKCWSRRMRFDGRVTRMFGGKITFVSRREKIDRSNLFWQRASEVSTV